MVAAHLHDFFHDGMQPICSMTALDEQHVKVRSAVLLEAYSNAVVGKKT
jgi:hypothetical protein